MIILYVRCNGIKKSLYVKKIFCNLMRVELKDFFYYAITVKYGFLLMYNIDGINYKSRTFLSEMKS